MVYLNYEEGISVLCFTRVQCNVQLREYQRMQPAQPPQALQVADAVTVRGLRGAPIHALTSASGGSGSGPATISPTPSPQPPDSHTPTHDDTPIICRLAERVRLKKVSKVQFVYWHYIFSMVFEYCMHVPLHSRM